MNRFISFMTHHSQLFVAAVALVVLTSGFIGMPFWDEDEPRFAAIAQTMVETGNWTVPLFNGELAVGAGAGLLPAHPVLSDTGHFHHAVRDRNH